MIAKIALSVLLITSSSIMGQDYEERMSTLEAQAHAHFYSNKDSTYHYYGKMHQLALGEEDHIKAIDNLNDLCVAAGVHYDLNKIESTIELLDSLIEKNKAALDTLPDKGGAQKNYLLYNKGNFYYTLENFEKSQTFFDAIVNNISQQPNYTENPDDVSFVSICYSFIAQMNSLQGRFKVADEYYQKNIRLYENHIPSDTEGLYKVYNLFAQSLYTQKKYAQAKKYWSTTFNYNEKSYRETNRNSLVTTGLSLATLYKDIGQLDSAMHYFKRLNKYQIDDDPFTDRFLTLKGEIQASEGQFEKALNSFREALTVSLPGDRPRIRKRIGDLYIKETQFDQALKSYQVALQELTSNFDPNDFSKNPDPNEIKQKPLLLNLLGAKAKTLSLKQNKNYIESAIIAVDTGIKTLDLLKPSFKNHSDKLVLIEDAFPLIETGMQSVYQSYAYEKNPIHIDKAFQYAEKSKAVILLDALLGVRASKFANVPEKLLTNEIDLKARISFIEKRLDNSSDLQNSNELKDELFSLKQEYNLLIASIEKDYADYYDLRYNTQVSSLESIQQMLSPDELLISYFYGNEAIYAIGVEKTSKHIERIPLDMAFEDEIKDLHQMLSDPTSDSSILAKASEKLYSNIIAPFIVSGGHQKLIIIPDGLLNYIPFGALNTKENGLSYLMESHTISYANSATLYAQLKNREIKDGKLLAFAPEFSGEQVQVDPSRDNLLPLPHNKREVEQILHSFSGQSYINKNASLENFTTELPNYGLLHLATHAVFDDTAPEYSYLAFSTIPKKESLLFVRDLYNLQINADLVTLSACESGVGELKRGEGFLSLTRGFFYSGASSIASTLWKINDASTTTLMDLFYQNLAEGDTKDLALQKAKKTFLDTNRQNGLSHPYYWSGFIISGNTGSLTSPNYWVWIGIGILLAMVAGFLVFRKKEANQVPSK